MRRRGVFVLSALVVFAYAAPLYAQAPPAALSGAEIALACAPSLTVVPERQVAHSLRVAGTQDAMPRTLFGNLDLVVISGGTRNGVQLAQQYAIRREYWFGRPSKGHLQTIHTTGTLRVVAVNDTTAIAQIENVCDGVSTGDYLEAYTPPPAVPAATSDGPPDFSQLGRVIFGDEERRLAGPGDFMILAQGGAPLMAGTRVAVYRDLRTPGIPLTAIGEGVIVSVGDTRLLRVTAGRDAIAGGDYIVPRK